MPLLPRHASSEERELFKKRLEAFSDLVFGFSLSLLALRLDVPADPHALYTAQRVVPFVLTFSIICAMWLEHYRIFRYYFRSEKIEVLLNFTFLFGIALLPYAVQTYIASKRSPITVTFYLGDFALVLLTLSTLRLLGLRSGAAGLSELEKLGDWKRVVGQMLIGFSMMVLVGILARGLSDVEQVLTYFIPVVLVVTVTIRTTIRRLPRFLRHKEASR